MKKTLLFGLSFFLYSWTIAQDNPNPSQNKIYRFNEVMLIELSMSDEDKTMLVETGTGDRDLYLNVNAHIKNSKIDTILSGIGIRRRGATSYGVAKKSFKISFTAFDGEKFYNHKKFNLKAMHNDPSMLREYLSGYVYRNYGVPSARSHFAQVYINNEYMGIYLNVEQIDDEFVDRRFDDNEAGNLYKCLDGSTLESLNGNIELKTNEDVNDWSRLEEFITLLNSPTTGSYFDEMERVFNVDNYLKQLAVETIIGHWDGYTRDSKNFYLYEDTVSMQIQYIPYDLDNTWGVDWGFVDWENEKINEWVFNAWTPNPLSYNIMLKPDNFRAYCSHMRTLKEYLFNEEYMNPLLDSVHKLIDSFIKEDTYYPLENGYSYNDFQNTLDIAWGQHVQYGLKDFVSLHESKVVNELMAYPAYDSVEVLDPFQPLVMTNPGDGLINLHTTSSNFTEYNISIFPNPVTDGYFTINIEKDISTIHIRVYDQMGISIPIHISNQLNGEYRIEFVNNPITGLYVLMIGANAQPLLVY